VRDTPSAGVERAHRRAQRIQFVAFTTVTFFVSMGVGLIIPILPQYKEIFQLSSAEAGLIPASFFAGRLVFDLIGGVLSDRVGRRLVLSVGCVLTGLASICAGLTSSFPVFLVALFAQGMGAGLFVTSAMSILIALIPPGRTGRAIGTYQSMSLLGFSVGPAVGGLTAASFGPRGPFFIYAVAAFGGLVVATAALRLRTSAASPIGPAGGAVVEWSLRSSLSLFRKRALLLGLLGTGTLAWTSGGIRGSAVPLFADAELGFDAIQNGLLMSASSLGQLAVLWPGGFLLDRIGRRPVIIASTLATSASIAMLAIATTPWMLVVVVALLGAALGCLGIGPWAILVDVVEPKLYGTAAGIQRTGLDVGKVLGPVFVGALIDAHGYHEAFALCAAIVGVTALVLLKLPETRPRDVGRRGKHAGPSGLEPTLE
jgi:DHA1 family multidrug resistance protein-like MFS transporter